MKRLILVVLGLLTATLAFVDAAPPQYGVQGFVNLAPSSPQLIAVDPFANHPSPSDPLKPARPFWYSVDENGLTILSITNNRVLYTVPWPLALDIVQPDGSYLTVPAPPDGWEPIGMVVSYPTEEALASNSETPASFVYVVMAHSGYEWASNPNPPDLRSPNLRDTLVPSTNPATESGMLVQVDVTDPSFSAAPPSIAGAILGHAPGQPAYEPATGSVYVGNMPSISLPTMPVVPNDLTSFVSVIAGLAPPAGGGEAGEVGPPAPPTILVLCGPEHPEIPILGGVPLAWACLAEGAEGPLAWEFTGLPSWLTAHPDKLTGDLDGILYGTPLEGAYTFEFQARVTDNGAEPPFTTDWTTISVIVDPTAEAEPPELAFEAGVPGGAAIEGTGVCTLGPTSSPGSLVPAWIDVVQVPGREIPNPTKPGGTEQTIGCVVMGTPPISGEYYEFAMPGFQFAYPWDRESFVVSGIAVGPYVFDPLPAGVTVSGLAWHQIDKIHDASTEADILNAEFFGVDPFTGQLYRVLPPQGALEAETAVIGPPTTSVETDVISAYGTAVDVLAALTTARPDIAAVLSSNPNLKVRFGDLVAEANRDPRVFVTAREIFDPTGLDLTVIPIGGPPGSTIEPGAVIKVSGTRDLEDPAVITLSAISPIALTGVQAYSLGLDSDLSPAAPGEPGQVDHGVLWVTGTTTGTVAVVDTALATSSQLLDIPGATSLGGVSVDFASRSAYIAGKWLHSAIIAGIGAAPAGRAPLFWGTTPVTTVGLAPIFYTGFAGSFTVTATGSPTPTLSLTGTLPAGLTFTDNGNGTATLAGSPAEGTYSFTVTAANGVLPNATVALALTVSPPVAPVFVSASSTTFTAGSPAAFAVTAGGGPTPTLSITSGALPAGVTFVDNGTGSATLVGIPAAAGSYPLTITAANGVEPNATQAFTLIVNPPLIAPAITSGNSTTFTVGSAGSFTVTATGTPTPALYVGGALPAGVTFADNGDGTATLAGTPVYGTQGNHAVVITAWTGLSPSAMQNFTLKVIGTRAKDDYDRDGKADLTIWSGSDGWWRVLNSSAAYGNTLLQQWGSSTLGDVPLPGDYDGDYRTDLGLWRPSDGGWYVLTSGSGYEYGSALVKQWGSGALGDMPVPGDYDGDGQTDFAIWRPSEGVWYVLQSSTGSEYGSAIFKQWGSGALGDIPVPGDYDDDGQTDFAIWRPSEGVWFVLGSASGYDYAAAIFKQWGSGALGDIPVPADYDGDGQTDFAIWRPSEGVWYVLTSGSGYDYAAALFRQWGSGAEGDVPVVSDYDGDGRADLAVWRPSAGIWFVLTSTTDYSYADAVTTPWGNGSTGDVTVREQTVRNPMP